MEKKLRITENLLLKILSDQSGLSRKDIAKHLKITPQWLSTILNSNEKLSEEIKERACLLFKVPPGYFDAEQENNLHNASIVSEPPPPEYQTGSAWQDIARQEAELKMEIERLKEQVRQAAARISERDGTIQEQEDMIQRLLSVIEKK